MNNQILKELLKHGNALHLEALDYIEQLEQRLQLKKLSENELFDLQVQRLREQKRLQDIKDHEFKSQGICPVCEGDKELGGQFTGGTWPCEACNGTGKYS